MTPHQLALPRRRGREADSRIESTSWRAAWSRQVDRSTGLDCIFSVADTRLRRSDVDTGATDWEVDLYDSVSSISDLSNGNRPNALGVHATDDGTLTVLLAYNNPTWVSIYDYRIYAAYFREPAGVCVCSRRRLDDGDALGTFLFSASATYDSELSAANLEAQLQDSIEKELSA